MPSTPNHTPLYTPATSLWPVVAPSGGPAFVISTNDFQSIAVREADSTKPIQYVTADGSGDGERLLVECERTQRIKFFPYLYHSVDAADKWAKLRFYACSPLEKENTAAGTVARWKREYLGEVSIVGAGAAAPTTNRLPSGGSGLYSAAGITVLEDQTVTQTMRVRGSATGGYSISFDFDGATFIEVDVANNVTDTAGTDATEGVALLHKFLS